jgi:vesicle coat complex subunit
LRGFF